MTFKIIINGITHMYMYMLLGEIMAFKHIFTYRHINELWGVVCCMYTVHA